EAVYLRAYGQKDPLVEYKNEAYEMFTELMGNIKGEILHNLFRSTSNLEAFGAFLQNLPQFLTSSDETGAQQTLSTETGRPAAIRTPTHELESNGATDDSSMHAPLASRSQPVRDV